MKNEREGTDTQVIRYTGELDQVDVRDYQDRMELGKVHVLIDNAASNADRALAGYLTYGAVSIGAIAFALNEYYQIIQEASFDTGADNLVKGTIALVAAKGLMSASRQQKRLRKSFLAEHEALETTKHEYGEKFTHKVVHKE